MQRTLHPQRGFTLVEIMIVVVIIGLLAALAIPAWQYVREQAIRKTMDNDARQLASAAQQYFCAYGVSAVALNYTVDGAITGDLSMYLKYISKNYSSVPNSLDDVTPFSLTHPHLGAARFYSAEGQLQP